MIWFDIDGVLADTVGGLLDKLNREEKQLNALCDINHRDAKLKYKRSRLEVGILISWFLDSGGIPKITYGAKDTLDWIKEKGLNYSIVTTRNPYYSGITKRWIKKRNLQPSEVVITTRKEVEGFMLFDDNPEDIRAFKEINPDGYGVLFVRPWNIDYIGEFDWEVWDWGDVKRVIDNAIRWYNKS